MIKQRRNDPKVASDFLRRLITDEQGQGTVEYILILSASVVGVTALARQMIAAMDKGMLALGAQLEQDLKVGRAPLSVWEN